MEGPAEVFGFLGLDVAFEMGNPTVTLSKFNMVHLENDGFQEKESSKIL